MFKLYSVIIMTNDVIRKKRLIDLRNKLNAELTRRKLANVSFTNSDVVKVSNINEIRNGGFKYKVYQIEIKGTIYNKVLIGPYSTKGSAGQDVDNIKEKLKVTNAFVVKF